MGHSEPRQADSEKGNETDSAKKREMEGHIRRRVKKTTIIHTISQEKKYEVNFPT